MSPKKEGVGAEVSTARPLTNLEKVFPHKTVNFEGQTITVTPLNAEHLIDAADAYWRMLQLKQSGKSDLEILMSAKDDLKVLIQKCIDVPLSQVPLGAIPLVALVVLRQNFTLETVKNWQALLREGRELFGQIG